MTNGFHQEKKMAAKAITKKPETAKRPPTDKQKERSDAR